MSYQIVNVRLPKDLYERLVERADAEDRTMAAQIRVALRSYLQKKDDS